MDFIAFTIIILWILTHRSNKRQRFSRRSNRRWNWLLLGILCPVALPILLIIMLLKDKTRPTDTTPFDYEAFKKTNGR